MTNINKGNKKLLTFQKARDLTIKASIVAGIFLLSSGTALASTTTTCPRSNSSATQQQVQSNTTSTVVFNSSVHTEMMDKMIAEQMALISRLHVNWAK